MARSTAISCLILLALTTAAHAAETETQYLSGKGKDDPVKWDFMCSAGQNAGKWSTIGVPSNWELQGFGNYTYGTARPNPWPKVTGNYKRTFTTPANWADKKVFITFEGVMTDTQVKINGESAGPIHQGGYYEFKYDITKFLKPAGTENLLEVTVDDESANQSVNNAERRGDYWNYAGIFRPVHLDALPETHIEHVAINAQADGTLTADVAMAFGQLGAELVLKCQIRDAAGNAVGTPFTQTVTGESTRVSSKLPNPKLWTAETPNLYTLDVELNTGATVFHTLHQKFGFRTIEARPGEGLFLNGTRIMLKGADRHSFWPDSGRCLSPEISRQDITLMKDMNMNAVRMSHYPPDRHFLDACDEMGMYVLDELAGWHQKYDTPTGTRLVKEMVTRDVNHPAILFWDNGNEGGWNNDLNGEFAKYDPQKRLVLHPWEEFPKGIVDTKHYPDYNLLTQKLNGNNVFFPTEMLHGLYDGGHGAGLEDYWNAIQKSKVSAGGFLWVLADETLKRTDKEGKLDSNGNQAPDGIVGPYREKEGSFYTIKQIWSPIAITTPPKLGILLNGGIMTVSLSNAKIENRYDFIDAQECSFTWELRKAKQPGDIGAGSDLVLQGKATSGAIAPHTSGELKFDLQSSGANLGPPALRADLLVIKAQDPNHREIMTWAFPFGSPSKYLELAQAQSSGKVASTEAPNALTATAGDLALQFDKQTGLLTAATRAGKNFSFLNGPRLVAQGPTPAAPARGGQPAAPTFAPDSKLLSLDQKSDGNDLLITAKFDGPLNNITYRVRPNGWLTIDYAYSLTGPHEYFGVGFDYPEANVKAMRYLGNGPSTVYQNRLAGGSLDVWDKKYNNTVVGDPDDLKPGEHFDYPIFKGYYAGVHWLQFDTTEGPITALLNQDDLFVQVLTPKTPPANQLGQTGVPFPKAGLSFLHAIPAIGSKFNGPKSTGPQGQPAIAKGEYKGSLSLYFGKLP